MLFNLHSKKMAFPSTLILIPLLSLALSQQASTQELHKNGNLAGIITCINVSIATVETYPVIPEAEVDVVCGVLFLEKVMKSTTTNRAGIYSFSFNAAEMLLLNVPELCHLNVRMPASLCELDPSGGFLKFPIIGIGSALDEVTEFIPGAPSYLSAQVKLSKKQFLLPPDLQN